MEEKYGLWIRFLHTNFGFNYGSTAHEKIGESMIVASVVGVAIVYKGGFFTAMSIRCTKC